MLVKIGEASQLLGICIATLRYRASNGTIPCIITDGGTRFFDLVSVDGKWKIKEGKDTEEKSNDKRKRIIYARVSTKAQVDDLERQVKFIQEKHKEYEVVKDVASGLNWKRKGLLQLLSKSRNGEIEEIVVSSRDRLCRFGFELLEEVFKLNGTKLVVLEHDEGTTKEQQLAEDILAIVHVFSCRRNGLRKYKNQDASDKETRKNTKALDEECSIDL